MAEGSVVNGRQQGVHPYRYKQGSAQSIPEVLSLFQQTANLADILRPPVTLYNQ